MAEEKVAEYGEDGLPSYRRADVEAEGRRIPMAATEAAGAGGGTFDPLDFAVRSLADVIPSGVEGGTFGVAIGGDAAFELTEDAARAVIGAVDPSSFAPVPGAKVAPGPIPGMAQARSDIMPPAIPAEPFPLDRSTQHLVDVSATELLEVVRRSLTDSAVDFAFNADKCKFTCVCFNSGADVEFRIFLYTVAERNMALEFQRRGGNSYLYNTVKQRVWASLDQRFKGCRRRFVRPIQQDAHARMGPSIPASACKFSEIKARPLSEDLLHRNKPQSRPVAPSAVAVHHDVGDSDSGAVVDVLTHLLSNECSDVIRAEGVRTAAASSKEESVRSAILAADLLPAIGSVLVGNVGTSGNEGDLVAKAHAATAIANLAESRTCHDSIVTSEHLLRALLRYTSVSHEATTAHLRRESARAVANLCASHGAKLAKSGGLEAVREVLGDGRADPIMREHAIRAQQAMVA